MATARQYVVGRHLRGELPDRMATFDPPESEEAAIRALKGQVMDATAEAVVNGDLSAARQVAIGQHLDALSIGLLLGLQVGEKLSVEVGVFTYYIRLAMVRNTYVREAVAQVPPLTVLDRKKKLQQELIEAIKGMDISEAQKVMRQLDDLPHDNREVKVQTTAREVKVQTIAGMFQYIRHNWLLPPDQLGAVEREHRTGYLHAILVAGGVPYAVAGEMRPSREWQTTFETVKLIALDKNMDARQSAEWLVDLPKGTPADPDQDDFAEQVRPEVVIESFATGGDTRKEGGDFFITREEGVGEVTLPGNDN